VANDLQEADEFDGRLYVLTYTRSDGTKQTVNPVGAKSIAALGAECAFMELGIMLMSRQHRRNLIESLKRAPLGTDVDDPVTRCTFRIDVAGQLPDYTAEGATS
jgi:hypothetical protein